MTRLRPVAAILSILGALGLAATASATTYRCADETWHKGDIQVTYEALRITPLGRVNLGRHVCMDAITVAQLVSRPEEPEGTHLNVSDFLGHYHCTYKPLENNLSSVWEFVCTAHGRWANRVTFRSLLQRG